MEKGYRLENVRAYVSINDDIYKPLSAVSGDVGLVTKAGINTIVWDPFAEFGYETITGEVKFRVQGDSKHTFTANWSEINDMYIYLEFFGATFGSYGCTLEGGGRHGGYGGYGRLSGLGGKESTLITSLGYYYRITKWLRFNAGLGYGRVARNEEIDGKSKIVIVDGTFCEAGITINFIKWMGVTMNYGGIIFSKNAPYKVQRNGFIFGLSFNF